LCGLAGFLFQAEDGIRGFHVTGVQTCALPISGQRIQLTEDSTGLLFMLNDRRESGAAKGAGEAEQMNGFQQTGLAAAVVAVEERSEERRVGKEWRARGSRQRSAGKWRRHSVTP